MTWDSIANLENETSPNKKAQPRDESGLLWRGVCKQFVRVSSSRDSDTARRDEFFDHTPFPMVKIEVKA